jgi:hypothetical protein
MLTHYSLAITARIWSNDPWVSTLEFRSRVIGLPSQVVAILWMGLSAFTDGCLSLVLILRFSRARDPSSPHTSTLLRRLITLTLETVLLTHLAGGIMCILFLTSSAAHRTSSPVFWVLLEIITELYALSMLFTINSRHGVRRSLQPGGDSVADDGDRVEYDLGQTALDRRVEGYQGSRPFGVAVNELRLRADGQGEYEAEMEMSGFSPSMGHGSWAGERRTWSDGYAEEGKI